MCLFERKRSSNTKGCPLIDAYTLHQCETRVPSCLIPVELPFAQLQILPKIVTTVWKGTSSVGGCDEVQMNTPALNTSGPPVEPCESPLSVPERRANGNKACTGTEHVDGRYARAGAHVRREEMKKEPLRLLPAQHGCWTADGQWPRGFFAGGLFG